ncbi:YndJ family protein [Evansella sp. AB-rgal1]|uniref:YndJ family protein n=1 Tax=Evansella sp. AB-rgal1 TaxID=3242696 RepID=UPI00359DC6AB
MQKRLSIQSCLGAFLWIMIMIIFSIELIESLLAFSFLILVPFALKITSSGLENEFIYKLFQVTILLQVPAALLGSISLVMAPGVLSGVFAIGWLAYTVLLGIYGVSRLIYRGLSPLEETMIDGAFIYTILGGGWLVLHRFAVEGLPFPSVIVLLTAIHFHYSAFILPIFTGLLGRYFYRNDIKLRGLTFIMISVLAGPMIVAAGITFGGFAEFLSVVFYVGVLYWLSVITIWYMLKGKGSRLGRFCVGVSSICLVGTMTLSFLYSYGITFGPFLLTIPDMALFHGVGNAFGYAFVGIIGWFMLNVKPRDQYYSIPISRMRERRLDPSFVKGDSYVTCLIDSIEEFKSDEFDPLLVHPSIQRFYEDTTKFRLVATTTWHCGFRMLSKLYHKITGDIGQLHLQPYLKDEQEQEMTGTIHAIKQELDGRVKPRVWWRQDKETDKTIFFAIYSHHDHQDKRYMNIALPLPKSVMTGILRVENDEDNGLILTSKKTTNYCGHAGIYLTIKKVTSRLPMEESFHIQVSSEGKLTAKHDLTFFGFRCLTINYKIFPMKNN